MVLWNPFTINLIPFVFKRNIDPEIPEDNHSRPDYSEHLGSRLLMASPVQNGFLESLHDKPNSISPQKITDNNIEEDEIYNTLVDMLIDRIIFEFCMEVHRAVTLNYFFSDSDYESTLNPGQENHSNTDQENNLDHEKENILNPDQENILDPKTNNSQAQENKNDENCNLICPLCKKPAGQFRRHLMACTKIQNKVMKNKSRKNKSRKTEPSKTYKKIPDKDDNDSGSSSGVCSGGIKYKKMNGKKLRQEYVNGNSSTLSLESNLSLENNVLSLENNVNMTVMPYEDRGTFLQKCTNLNLYNKDTQCTKEEEKEVTHSQLRNLGVCMKNVDITDNEDAGHSFI